MGARCAIPASAIGGIVTLVLSCGDGAVEPTPPPAPVATTVTVNPASAAMSALGETTRFTAEVRDQNGQVMAGAAVAWASSDASVAAVDASGRVTAAGNGSATIAATSGAASGTAAVTVAQAVNAVAVSPAVDTLVAVGDTVRLIAEATDANGHAVAAITEFVWSSSDTLVARVDGSGLVESVAEGEAAVTATTSEVTGSAELTVVSPLPTTVAVSPDTVRFTALGQTTQLAAEVREQAGRVMAEVIVSWSSGDTLVAVVDSAGLLTAVGGGTTTVTAVAGELAGAVVVTVMQSAGSVVVSPAESTIALGDTLRLAAEAFDENGHRVDGAVFSWSSSDAGVARVDDTGLVEGVAKGTARIRATASDVSGTGQITVENPDRTALVALYEATDGPNWVNNDNWLTEAPLGEWFGVDVNDFGRVTGLDLGGQWVLQQDGTRRVVSQGLAGAIPPEIEELTSLESLDLWGNELADAIPPELGNLASLRWLNLSWNKLTGTIPEELGDLADLEHLNLYFNRLSSQIPRELGGLAKLERLSLGSNQLEGSIPPELGNLDGLRELWLWGNQLTGSIPPELGNLANLRRLDLSSNELTGTIPRNFLQLRSLTSLVFYNNDGLCAPGTVAFADWFETMEVSGPFCNQADREVLEKLFETTGGSGWTRSDGWLATHVLGKWHGVVADSLGRVATLDLTRNGLVGSLPGTLGNLIELTRLRIGGNVLSGRLPASLTALSLVEFVYDDTELCVHTGASFRAWLAAIPTHEGTGADCPPLSDREILEMVYDATGGPDWTNNENWLTDRPLGEWHGIRENRGRVTSLRFLGN
ncbi:MAG: Ig-like domain-containing protein, partial [Gemmatimonadota bacterium]|nr:Ig-like domain-containing protein [Gemmatimonadota bacterium]